MGTLRYLFRVVIWIMAVLVLSYREVGAGTIKSCSECHEEDSLKTLATSVHSGLECTDCHSGISLDRLDFAAGSPHGEKVEPVDCQTCHEEAAKVYVRHGRLQVGSNPDIPKCSDCHGSHDILPSSDPKSHIHPTHLPDTCRKCHTDVDLVKKHPVLRDAPIRNYENSVHGEATANGLIEAAQCHHCHSAKGPDGKPTAHRILNAGEPESSINHFAIPNTCGKCHEAVAKEYWQGIHGQLVAQGSVDAPVCTRCHGEHGIVTPEDPQSPVCSARVAQETCTPCHQSEVLNRKYGISTAAVPSYIDSYHGLKSKAGDRTVANCASCHGAHLILPSGDQRSSIYPDNLQKTCGECHPKISAANAKTPIHLSITSVKRGLPGLLRYLYMGLIATTIGLMGIHNLADWWRYFRALRKKPYVRRLTASEVVQHWILMLSFTVLVLTGFSLRFSEAWWVKILFGWPKGFELRGVLHRWAAIVMLIGCGLHFLYLFSQRGKTWVKDMWPARSDLQHVWQNVQYFLGRRPKGPAFGRFSYMEKAEYWALIWGTILMTVTGFLLWFDNFFTERGVGPTLMSMAHIIHYYEAWLALLSILVWHLYGVILKPGVYPMSPAWLTGKMPAEMYHHEHPTGPALEVNQPKDSVKGDTGKEER